MELAKEIYDRIDMNCAQLLSILLTVYTFFLSSSDATQCFTKGRCSCDMSDGSGTIDLHGISNAKAAPRFDGIKQSNNPDFTFQYDPCNTFSNGNCKDVLVCQVFKDNQNQFDAGEHFSAQISGAENQLNFIYQSVPAKRTTTIALVCDLNAHDPVLETFSESLEQPDHYLSKLTSKYACPVKHTAKKKKLSVGTILCILLLVSIVSYFAIGIVVNKFARNREGKDALPNVNFWLDCPSLVKDGCIFTYSKVKGRSSEYESI